MANFKDKVVRHDVRSRTLVRRSMAIGINLSKMLELSLGINHVELVPPQVCTLEPLANLLDILRMMVVWEVKVRFSMLRFVGEAWWRSSW